MFAPPVAFIELIGKKKEEIVKICSSFKYKEGPSYETHLLGVEAAGDAFDLTNNPVRSSERRRCLPVGRSVSSGDIVKVDDESFLCLFIGWERLNQQ